MLCKQLFEARSPKLETYLSLINLRKRSIGSLKNKRPLFSEQTKYRLALASCRDIALFT
jgi:hypothetical protein